MFHINQKNYYNKNNNLLNPGNEIMVRNKDKKISYGKECYENENNYFYQS